MLARSAAAIVAVTAASGLSAATAVSSPRVYIAPGFYAGDAVYRPAKFWASGDATLLFRSIKWSHYGSTSATATASGGINDCEPSCAGGTMHYYKARLRMSRVRNTCGHLFFTRLHITWTGTIPDGEKRSSYFLPGAKIVCGE